MKTSVSSSGLSVSSASMVASRLPKDQIQRIMPKTPRPRRVKASHSVVSVVLSYLVRSNSVADSFLGIGPVVDSLRCGRHRGGGGVGVSGMEMFSS